MKSVQHEVCGNSIMVASTINKNCDRTVLLSVDMITVIGVELSLRKKMSPHILSVWDPIFNEVNKLIRK